MMKRIVGMMVALILVCGILPAYAAGGIDAVEENWYVVSRSDNYRVYFYAVVTNNGSAPESVNDLLFEIKDGAETTIESTAKYKLYPEVLEPGQSGWLTITQDVKDIEDVALIDHCALTITSKANDDEAARLLTATAEYLAEDEDENENVIRAAVTNSGEGNAFEITAAVIARDADGKLLYVDSAATKDVGLAAGDSLLVRWEIKSDIVDALEDAGIEVASVEALAYTIEDLDD